MQFSANVIRFIVKAKLNSIFTNDLKRKYFFLENVHNCSLCRLRHFKVNAKDMTSEVEPFFTVDP